MNKIIFQDSYSGTEGEIVRDIPLGITTKDELMTIYAEIPEIPGYFGKNWDALRDVLVNANIIGERTLVLVHNDIPFKENSEDRRIYLEIIEEAGKTDSRKIKIVFPTPVRIDDLAATLKEAGK